MKSLARPSDRVEIARRLSRLQPDASRRWGAMSAHEMVCHLADSYGIGLGERPAGRVPNVWQRTLVKWTALYVPLPWPRGIRTTPEVDPRRSGTRPTEFQRDLARLLAVLDRFSSETRSLDGRRHPVFGRMSDAQWLRWGGRHADHHLRQFGL